MNPEQPGQSSSEQPEDAAGSVVEKMKGLQRMLEDTLNNDEELLEKIKALLSKLENTYGELGATKEQWEKLREELKLATESERKEQLEEEISEVERHLYNLRRERISLHEELDKKGALQGELRQKIKDIQRRFDLLDSFPLGKLPRNN